MLHKLFSKEKNQILRLTTLPRDQTSAHWIIQKADAGSTGHTVPHGQQVSLAFNHSSAFAPFLLRRLWQICLRTQQHLQPFPRNLTSSLQPQRGDQHWSKHHMLQTQISSSCTLLLTVHSPAKNCCFPLWHLPTSLSNPQHDHDFFLCLWICSQCC